VIHTAGPVHPQDPNPDATLARCYESCLAIVVAHGLRTVAFPSISTGAYLFPIRDASRIALSTVSAALRAPSTLDRVTFVLFSEADFDAYRGAADALDFPEISDG
jgi:O-acetyl-ADP-ribose deacetylase (regulator of RNase III)